MSGKGILGMSEAERERGHVIRQVVEKHVRQGEAAERLGLGVRQIKRLVQRWRREGDAGLVSRQRGSASHNRLSAAARDTIEALLRDRYRDFGATLATEKLAALHGITVSVETVRQMQMALGLWQPKKRRSKRVFQVRQRRPRYGELVQIDGSPHDWFEGRAPRCNLTVFIDDATSKLLALRFSPSETTRVYLEALRGCVLQHGMPLAYYSDRHGIFRVNAKEAASGDGFTEFGRVLKRLNITSICAHTPQAKGRVERANQTLQDRLVKELRLQNINTIEQANAFVPTFITAWNAKFAVPPRDLTDAHRPWTGTVEALEDALARREERTLSKALSFRTGGTMYGVKTDGPGTALRGAKVTLYHLLNGTMSIHYKDRTLTATAFKTFPVPDPTEDEKTIDARVDAILANQPPVQGSAAEWIFKQKACTASSRYRQGCR
jgi:transposase